MADDASGGSETVAAAMRRIFANTGWLAASKVVSAVLSLFYIAIVTRTLGVANFGLFATVLASGQLVATIVKFESWQGFVKFGQKPLQAADSGALASLVTVAAAVDLGGALVGSLLALAFSLLVGPMLGWDSDLQIYAICYALILLFAVRSTPMGLLRLLDRFDAGALAESMIPITRMIGALLALAFRPDILGFLTAWAISEAIASISYWMLSYRCSKQHVARVGFGELRAKFARFPGFFRFALATNVTTTLAAFTKQGPVLLLGLFAGQNEAGLYRLAQQLAKSLGKLTGMFARAMFAEMARSHERSEGEEGNENLRQIAGISIKLGMGSGLLIAALILMLGEFILVTMSGKEYLGAYPLLLLLGIAGAVSMMGAAFEPFLLATGRILQAVTIRLLALTLLFALLAWLLPIQGVAGAAGAVLLVAIFSELLRAIYVRRLLRRD